jgi:hypothetical protein
MDNYGGNDNRMNLMSSIGVTVSAPFAPRSGDVRLEAPSRRIVLHDPRYPCGCGLLIAWDCDHGGNGFSRYLFRSGNLFVSQSSDPSLSLSDQVVILREREARALYQVCRAKVVREDDAFAHPWHDHICVAD